MLHFSYPGIYTQYVPSGVRSIAGAPTSVALFVGPTRAGIDGRPIRLLNYGDFERAFGGLAQTSALSYSVLHFFSGGGGQAFVIRVPVRNSDAASTQILRDGNAAVSVTVTALGSGAAGGDIFVEIDHYGINADPYGGAADRLRFNLTITDTVTGRVERFANLSTVSTTARYVENVVNDIDTGSQLVRVDVTPAQIGQVGPQDTGSHYRITAPLTAGTFANAIRVRVNVQRRAADGTVDAANSISNEDMVVFATGEGRPVTALDLVTRMVRAINRGLRQTQAARIGDAQVEGAVFENGLFRLRLSAPAGPPGTLRLHDGTVTIADPAGAANTRLLSVLNIAQQLANPSRYRLGHAYAASQIPAATAGAQGDPSGQPDSNAFRNAVSALEVPDPFFNLLCLPDAVQPSATDPNALHHGTTAWDIYAEGARICAQKFAFLLVDPPPNVKNVGAAEAWKSGDFTFQSDSAGAWFPNIRVTDTLSPGTIRSHPPSGAVAGLIARTDNTVGVWQAPAGTDAVVTGAFGPEVELSDAEHGLLNPIGVNVIRRFPIFGTVAFGSRTVNGSDALASDFKYIPVRRTADYILRSLSEGLRWAVHKPNGEALWSELRVATTAFMHGLFRQGAFKGVSSREAYFVACDASTTSADDINAGIARVVVGFAPLKPAEFVVISLRQIVQSSN